MGKKIIKFGKLMGVQDVDGIRAFVSDYDGKKGLDAVTSKVQGEFAYDANGEVIAFETKNSIYVRNPDQE